jgi:hypothetical protein
MHLVGLRIIATPAGEMREVKRILSTISSSRLPARHLQLQRPHFARNNAAFS